jgi:chaperonin GroES
VACGGAFIGYWVNPKFHHPCAAPDPLRRTQAGQPAAAGNSIRPKHLKGVPRMATKLTPLHDRIVVRRVEEAETTRGGIIIPDSAKDKPQEGEVISVGRGKSNDKGETFPLDVKAGDRVLFGKYAGTEIKIDGEDFLIMREEEVLGILEGAGKPALATK